MHGKRSAEVCTIVAKRCGNLGALTKLGAHFWLVLPEVGVSTRWVRKRRSRSALLQFHHFLLFRLAHLFHLLDLAIGQLLNLIQGALLFVFGNLLVLQRLLDGVVSITA